ncbi:ABC transporter permease [Vibrio mangrovi]|uniref:FtsX-like permease family protein n=1 Tax=Vibrio mangrovi TaxID=474394 RepID=A0A1Y6ITF9_9VIBR|nr:ABC transporter permease [Vibrio mangrovi]MDW6003852.1 FtsX-like permease family protein [Vibrio mangrovi]SMR99353.1 FtsX-like permease family protein [Vibrio mangrovi]
MLCPVVKVLLGHYRRSPLQILLVWLGLTLGVSILIGVTAITEHARKSYAHGEKLFANPLPYHIRSRSIENLIPYQFYLQLQQSGFQQCVPFSRFKTATQSGQSITVVGMDPASMGNSTSEPSVWKQQVLPLLIAPHSVIISRELAKHEQLKNGDWMTISSGERLGPVIIDQYDWVYGSRVMTSLSLIRSLTGTDLLSAIACRDMPNATLQKLKQLLPPALTISRQYRSDVGSLTKAFLLNLDVIGVLAFLVGLFIFYQAISLSFIQRQPLVGMMRQAGVSGVELAKALMVELSLLILFSWISGNLLGLLLADRLIPSVYATVMHDQESFFIDWNWHWGIYSLVMATIGALAACIWPLIRLLKSPSIRLTAKVSLVRFAGIEFACQAIAAILLFGTAILIYLFVKQLWVGFVVPAMILISVGLITPFLFWKVCDLLSYRLKDVKRRWFFADAAASMGYRGIATMAFLIALTANIGVETLVGSFRGTTEHWLNERLAADMYVYASPSSQADIIHWLHQQNEVGFVWKRWERDIPSDQGLIQVVSTGSTDIELGATTMKVAVPDFWEYLHHSKSLLISESMSLKLGIRPGELISLPPPLGKGWYVAGVYYDYGNPFYQVLISEFAWNQIFGSHGDIILNVTTKSSDSEAENRLKQRLLDTFYLDSDRVFDNRAIHQAVMKTFDRTFSIADKLSKITLLIAVIGIFFATLSGELARRKHLTLMRYLGVSGKELIMIGSLQLSTFGIISLFIAIPLGITLSVFVMDMVIRQTFGWSVQLYMMYSGYLTTALWSIAALVIAGAIPVIRLTLGAPIKSFRDSL